MSRRTDNKTKREINRLKKRAYQRGLYPPVGKQLPHVPIREYDFYDYGMHFGCYHFGCTPPGPTHPEMYRCLMVEPEQLHPLQPCWDDDWMLLTGAPVDYASQFQKDLCKAAANDRGSTNMVHRPAGFVHAKPVSTKSPLCPFYQGRYTTHSVITPMMKCSGAKMLLRHQLNFTKLLIPYRQRFDLAGSIFTVQQADAGSEPKLGWLNLLVRWRHVDYTDTRLMYPW